MTGSKGAVTGANGFVGRALCASLRSRGVEVLALVREAVHGSTDRPVGNIGPRTDWTSALAGVDWVVHCAARAHVIRETAPNSPALYREVNVAGTRRLAEDAARVGVRRIVFVSSIGVLGNDTSGRGPFRASEVAAPRGDYAVSKLEAEQALWQVSSDTGIEVVVVRAPLVYGAGVKGNFLRLMQLVARGIPLPLGGVDNRRSLLGVANLADLLALCTDHAAAPGRTLLVSDGEDLSTPELIRRLAQAMRRPARLVPVPVALLRAAARLAGRTDEVERLVSSLQVDIGETREVLGWRPPVGVDESLISAAEWFVAAHDSRA